METMGRKLFVGGVSRDTTESTLNDYFIKFGDLEECLIINDRDTGFSKGFGFVTFTDSSMAEQALAQQHHTILGRKVDVKPARPRGLMDQSDQEHGRDLQQEIIGAMANQSRVKKIFVGGLPNGLTITEFRAYFETYGSVEDVIVIHDGEGKPRGFGFVTFDSEEAALNVLKHKYHELKNKIVEVKRAEPKERMARCAAVISYDSFNTGLPRYGGFYDPWGSFGPCMYYPPQLPFYPYGYVAPAPGYWNGLVTPSQAPPMFSTSGEWSDSISLNTRFGAIVHNPCNGETVCNLPHFNVLSISEPSVENGDDGNANTDSVTSTDDTATAADVNPDIETVCGDSSEENRIGTDENASEESGSTSSVDDQNGNADDNPNSDSASANLKMMIGSTMRNLSRIRPLNA